VHVASLGEVHGAITGLFLPLLTFFPLHERPDVGARPGVALGSKARRADESGVCWVDRRLALE